MTHLRHSNVLIHSKNNDPVDTGRKLTYIRRAGRLRNVLCKLNLRLLSTGEYERVLSDKNYALVNTPTIVHTTKL